MKPDNTIRRQIKGKLALHKGQGKGFVTMLVSRADTGLGSQGSMYTPMMGTQQMAPFPPCSVYRWSGPREAFQVCVASQGQVVSTSLLIPPPQLGCDPICLLPLQHTQKL